MGWFTSLKKSASRTIRGGVKLVKKTGLGNVARVAAGFVPGANLALTAVDLGMKLSGGLGGGMGSSVGMPKLQKLSNLPPPPGGFALPQQQQPSGGGRGTVSVPGRRRLEDMTLQEMQAMDAAGERLPASAGRTVLKSPDRRFVVIKDKAGRTHILRKDVARFYGWKPGKKPPISVGMHSAIKKAGRAIDKFNQLQKDAAKMISFKRRMSGGGGHGHQHARLLAPGREIIIEKKGK